MHKLRLAIFLALSFLAPRALAGTPEYYMVMFGYQGSPDLARSSHTFATFVEVQDGQIDQEVTVSWLPAPGYFGPDNTMPLVAIVPGHNYTLDETIAIGGRGAAVNYWGPYQIDPELFQRAADRATFLNEGTTSYKMMIIRQSLREPALSNQPGGVINCIMGVSDLGGYLETGTAWGYEASQQVLSWLSHWAYEYPSGVRGDIAELMQLQQRLNPLMPR